MCVCIFPKVRSSNAAGVSELEMRQERRAGTLLGPSGSSLFISPTAESGMMYVSFTAVCELLMCLLMLSE